MADITSQYPLIEAIKRSVITAFRKAVVKSFPDKNLARVTNNIEMEYPFENEKFPGIWVRFSLNEIQRASLDPTHFDGDGKYMLGRFSGRVSLEIAALSSKERDGISSGLINMLLFGRENEFANAFFETIEEIDYLAITIQDGIINPGGQTETISDGEHARLVYSDSYSFNIVGQWASRYENPTQLVRLREILINQDMKLTGNMQMSGSDSDSTITPGDFI